MRCTATPQCGDYLDFVKQNPGDSYWAMCFGCGRLYEALRSNPAAGEVLAIEGNGVDIRIQPLNLRTLAKTVAD